MEQVTGELQEKTFQWLQDIVIKRTDVAEARRKGYENNSRFETGTGRNYSTILGNDSQNLCLRFHCRLLKIRYNRLLICTPEDESWVIFRRF